MGVPRTFGRHCTSLATKENDVIISMIRPRGDAYNNKALEVNQYLGGMSRNIRSSSDKEMQSKIHLTNT